MPNPPQSSEFLDFHIHLTKQTKNQRTEVLNETTGSETVIPR